MRIAILAGGVGGARMARGFSRLQGVDTTVIVNVGDDDVIYGLDVSPDIDTVVYTLADEEGEHGWGRANDTWTVMDELASFDIDTSFRIGDRDLATNVYRTAMLRRGHSLSEVTAAQAKRFGIQSTILPASDESIRTRIQIEDGEAWIDFQTYFVGRKHTDRVLAVEYAGADDARPAPGVVSTLRSADAVVFAPSNPLLSVLPVLAIEEIHAAVSDRPVMAVSPFIGGNAIKGPAADLMRWTGHDPTPSGLDAVYGGIVDHIVVDPADVDPGARPHVHAADIMIESRDRATELAQEMITWLS